MTSFVEPLVVASFANDLIGQLKRLIAVKNKIMDEGRDKIIGKNCCQLVKIGGI